MAGSCAAHEEGASGQSLQSLQQKVAQQTDGAAETTPVSADPRARLHELFVSGVEGEKSGDWTNEPGRRRLLSPLEIHFSQAHIRPEFQDGRLVEETAAQVERESLGPACLVEEEEQPSADETMVGLLKDCPSGSDRWWLLRPPFPEIEVIEWRIKLRSEDGSPLVDEFGNELYGEKEWYTLDNRRLYCLQRAAAALHPQQVRCAVLVIRQEDGSWREFRKFRTCDRGRTIRVGHRDAPNLPQWSWRHEVGLPEEELTAGVSLAKPAARRRSGPGGIRAGGPFSSQTGQAVNGRHNNEQGSYWTSVANALFFVMVYMALRIVVFALRRLFQSISG